MTSGMPLWCGNCSCSLQSCWSLNLCQRRSGSFALPTQLHRQQQRQVLRKQQRLPSRRPQLRIGRAVATNEEVEQQFLDEAEIVGTIAIPLESSSDARVDNSESSEPESTVIECTGIITRPFSDFDHGTSEKALRSYGDAELLSRCTSVAERSAIALATMAYERAKRLFSVVSANLADLENVFKKRNKTYGGLTPSAADDEHDPRDELRELNARLEQELSAKDHELQLALMEVKSAHEQLRALQLSPPKYIHEVDAVIDDAVDMVNTDIQFDEAEEKSQQDLLLVEEKVATLLDKVGHLNGLVTNWNNAISLLKLESQHSSESLQLSVQELVNAQLQLQDLKALTEKQAADILANNNLLAASQGELSNTREELEKVSKFLSAVEKEKFELEGRIKRLEDSLKHEKETIVAVIRSSSSQKEELSAAEKKVSSLTTEITSLKSLLDGKEELILAMREEARRNSSMLVSAAKTREALLIAEKRIEQLTSQVNALDDEVKSRDLVLNEIKEEAVQSTEALRLAAQIKQDLNLSRQRELEVSQELDSMKNVVKDLRQELVENNRAVRAEQALRQLESEMDEVTAEVDILRKGVEARDEAIQLMKEEVDRNIDVLSHAAGNRELVRELEEHIEELKAELRKKDTMLAAMGKGLDTGSGVPSSSSSSTLYKSGLYEDASSSYNLPPSSSSSHSLSNEGFKARKRVNRSSSGGGYKRTPRQTS